MSRVLKFRAYDSASGKVSEPFDVKESWGDYLIDFGDYSADGALDSIIWEQFTGLLDRNDKEIYEGDIVKTTDRVTVKDLIFPIGVVEFKQQAFWICNVPSERPDFTHNETLLQYWETDLEVIGNVHETPELLEDK